MRKSERRVNAINAQNFLVSNVLEKPRNWPDEIITSSSKLLWRISSRHRQSIPYSVKHWICRGCKNLLRPGLNARVRLIGKIRRTTCLNCGKIRRYVYKTKRGVC